jgi:hypothetical protein
MTWAGEEAGPAGYAPRAGAGVNAVIAKDFHRISGKSFAIMNAPTISH